MILFSRLADAISAGGDSLHRILGRSLEPRCRACGRLIAEGEPMTTHLNESSNVLTGVRTVVCEYSHRKCTGRATKIETSNSLPDRKGD